MDQVIDIFQFVSDLSCRQYCENVISDAGSGMGAEIDGTDSTPTAWTFT